MLPIWSNRSPSFVVKMHILRKITIVFKNQSNHSGIWGQRVNRSNCHHANCRYAHRYENCGRPYRQKLSFQSAAPLYSHLFSNVNQVSIPKSLCQITYNMAEQLATQAASLPTELQIYNLPISKLKILKDECRAR